MPSQRRHITHVFGGGWATDFGPSWSTDQQRPLDQQRSTLVLPFLVDAEDVLFELDGGPRTAPGTVKLNSAALESGARIMGIHDYWKMGNAGTPTQKRVIFIGTKVYKDDADGTFTEIKSGLVSGAVPHMTTFDDLLILANDSTADVPMSYDGTTFQNLAGSPPNFSFSTKHQNYHFAAGVWANPSTLYYSSSLDPETWSGGTSGSISVNPNDGDMITGIVSHKNELIVFKGPYKGSIHRITGTSNSTWAREQFVEGVGAVWQNSIFRYRDDIGFLWSDGTIRSLNAVNQFGDYAEAAISVALNNNYLKSRLNFAQLRKASAVSDGSSAYILLPVDGSSQNNVMLAVDFRFEPPRWSKLVSFNYASAGVVIDSAASNRPQVFFGGHDGFVEKWGQPTKHLADGDRGMSIKVTTPFMDYGSPENVKTLNAIGLGMQPRNNANVTVGWQRDGASQQTTTIAQGGSDVLGEAAANEFTLDTSTLATSRFITRWYDAHSGGEFREVQYQFTAPTSGVETEIHRFIADVVPGSESLEN